MEENKSNIEFILLFDGILEQESLLNNVCARLIKRESKLQQ